MRYSLHVAITTYLGEERFNFYLLRCPVWDVRYSAGVPVYPTVRGYPGSSDTGWWRA